MRPDLRRLGPPLAETYVDPPDDPATAAWLAGPGSSPHGVVRTAAQRFLRRFGSDFEVNARLGMYSLHLAGAATFRALLRDRKLGTLLDIGAGTGEVTAELAPLFGRVVATETSPAMAARVQARISGDVRVVDLSLPDDESEPLGTFDVVSLLNVLDRTARPQTLLDRALGQLDPDGTLLLATPLPARPHVDSGGATADPEEPMGGDGDDFESALSSLHAALVSPRMLEVVRWTRLPYRSQGDRDAPRYEHDDAILVLRRMARDA